MIKDIQRFFNQYFSPSADKVESEHQVNLAAAALLVEMCLQDDEMQTIEVDMVHDALIEHLGLSESEAAELFRLAEAEKHAATDYHQFTRLIASHYDQAQKIHLVELLWRVAYADGFLDSYEELMVRRICDLIYVSHKDFLQAKHRVMDSSEGKQA